MDHSLKENQIICLKAIANGDRRAFERLYSSTSSCLFAIALRMLRNRQWAEEVMVDGFLTVWQRAGDYDPAKSSPMTWLTHIIRNRCIDGLRSRQDAMPNWKKNIVTKSLSRKMKIWMMRESRRKS